VVIDNMITHGSAASANGSVKLSKKQTYAFCDVYEFRAGRESRIKEVSEYLIKT
jgi:hypothetical protein